MGRDIKKHVAGKNPVLASPPYPVVRKNLAGHNIDEFRTGPAKDEISVGRPIPIASMMWHAHLEKRLVCRTVSLYYASPWIAPHGDAWLTRHDQLTRPDQSTGYKHIHRGIEALAARATPQFLPGFC